MAMFLAHNMDGKKWFTFSGKSFDATRIVRQIGTYSPITTGEVVIPETQKYFRYSDEYHNAEVATGVKFEIVKLIDFNQFMIPMHVVDMDYLGFSSIYLDSSIYGVKLHVPVLARVRLLRSLVNNKSGKVLEDEDEFVSGIASGLIRYVTLYSLYLIGGWAYPDLVPVIEERLKGLKESLGSGSKEV